MPSYKARSLEELAAKAGRLRAFLSELDHLRTERVTFANETGFRRWFEEHVDLFGFRGIIVSQEKCPDMVLRKKRGGKVRVELEACTSTFTSHKHDSREVDMVVAISGSGWLPIPSFTLGSEFRGTGCKNTVSQYVTLPIGLHTKIQKLADEGVRPFHRQVRYMLGIALECMEKESGHGLRIATLHMVPRSGR
jgi:hypothetical protein